MRKKVSTILKNTDNLPFTIQLPRAKEEMIDNLPVKVVHLVAGNLNGGAARGAYWLHRGLLEIGVESVVITTSSETFGDLSVVSLIKQRKDKFKLVALNQLGNLPTSLYRHKSNRIFSTGFTGFNLKDHPEIVSSDIVHMHWINGLISTRHIPKLGKPVVWTLRDMWPVTGGCHYSMECDRFTSGCGNCPQLGSNSKFDLSRFIAKQKLNNLPKDLVPVGISHWLTDQASRSSVFKDHSPVTILNNIDTKLFTPLPKNVSRDILNIRTEKFVILLGATDVNAFYKGFDKALSALKFLDPREFLLCIFGKVEKKILDDTGFEYQSLGYLNDNISLRLAYSCADVFVAPSIMEGFGKTIAESLACGTPVVCFDATGPKSIVTHKEDGYKAKPFDEKDLAYGINWVVREANYEGLQKNARANAVNKFDSLVIAAQYQKLYLEVLQK